MTHDALFSVPLSFTCCVGTAEASELTLPCVPLFISLQFCLCSLFVFVFCNASPLRVSRRWRATDAKIGFCFICGPTLAYLVPAVLDNESVSRKRTIYTQNQSKILILCPSQLGFSPDPSSTSLQGLAQPRKTVWRPRAVPFQFLIPSFISSLVKNYQSSCAIKHFWGTVCVLTQWWGRSNINHYFRRCCGTANRMSRLTSILCNCNH